jgi:hypothetical protein
VLNVTHHQGGIVDKAETNDTKILADKIRKKAMLQAEFEKLAPNRFNVFLYFIVVSLCFAATIMFMPSGSNTGLILMFFPILLYTSILIDHQSNKINERIDALYELLKDDA